jgi:hypothetical protein
MSRFNRGCLIAGALVVLLIVGIVVSGIGRPGAFSSPVSGSGRPNIPVIIALLSCLLLGVIVAATGIAMFLRRRK